MRQCILVRGVSLSLSLSQTLTCGHLLDFRRLAPGSDTAKPRVIKAKKTASKKGSGGKGGRAKSSGTKGDTQEIIRSYLYSMSQLDRMQVNETEVLEKTGYKRTDSPGYRVAIKALTMELKHVTKDKGNLSLTDVGLEYIAEHGVAMTLSPPTMQEHQEKLKATVADNAKAPAKAVEAIWNVMIDRMWHSEEELLAAAGYKRADSTGYREIKKWFNKLGLMETGGKRFKFTDKVYLYGEHPN